MTDDVVRLLVRAGATEATPNGLRVRLIVTAGELVDRGSAGGVESTGPSSGPAPPAGIPPRGDPGQDQEG